MAACTQLQCSSGVMNILEGVDSIPYSGRNKVEFNVFQLLTMCVFDCFLLLNRNDFHDGFK